MMQVFPNSVERTNYYVKQTFYKNYAHWFFFNMSSPIVGSSNTTNRGLWNTAIINDIIRFSLKLNILRYSQIIWSYTIN